LFAPSAEAISEKYPELQIVKDPPAWMDADSYQLLRSQPLWLDDEPPEGMLRAVVADRGK
jgi:hypothetical protein